MIHWSHCGLSGAAESFWRVTLNILHVMIQHRQHKQTSIHLEATNDWNHCVRGVWGRSRCVIWVKQPFRNGGLKLQRKDLMIKHWSFDPVADRQRPLGQQVSPSLDSPEPWVKSSWYCLFGKDSGKILDIRGLRDRDKKKSVVKLQHQQI